MYLLLFILFVLFFSSSAPNLVSCFFCFVWFSSKKFSDECLDVRSRREIKDQKESIVDVADKGTCSPRTGRKEMKIK
jgi:hypothetical protein